MIDYRKALLPRQPSPAFSPHSSGQSVLLSQGKAQIEDVVTSAVGHGSTRGRWRGNPRVRWRAQLVKQAW